LTLGSGPAGSTTCEPNFGPPQRVSFAAQVSGGGVVLLQAGALTVAPTGRISADGTSYDSRAASAGGTVLLRGDTLTLGTAQVSAEGGVEPSVFGVPTVAASPGYVIVLYRTALSGSTVPPAFSRQVP
jgi:hypothetical protein